MVFDFATFFYRVSMNRQNFSIFVWNAQGVGSSNFLYTLKDFIRIYDPKILVLVETKISALTTNTVCHKIGFDGTFRVEAEGLRGGIWILWRSDSISLRVICSSPNLLQLKSPLGC